MFLLTLLASAPCAANVVLEWNEIALAHVLAAKQPPPESARTMALMHVAIFHAMNAADTRYGAYAFDQDAPVGISADAAAVGAAAEVLRALFPAAASDVEAAYTASIARLPGGPGKAAGIELGRQVARTCLELRAEDGSVATAHYRPTTAPGVYVATVLPVATQWPKVKPWFMTTAAQFRPGPPPSLDSPRWTRDFDEIKRLGAANSTTRSAEQTDAARFWTVTGAPTWNPIVRSLAISNALDPLATARVFALANMAASDAFIAVFEAKYTYQFWRPITAIRNADLDGNDATELDPGWVPLVDTPLHPEYPCAHCISAAAVGAVLEAQFGSGEVPEISMTSTAAPGVVRRWTRIDDYVREVADARVWGGVHYRNSVDVSRLMGRRIGTLALQNGLRPIK